MDLNLVFSFIAAVTGAIVVMTMQPPFFENASISKFGRITVLNFAIASNLPNCHVTKIRVEGMHLLKVRSHTDVLLWKNQIPVDKFSDFYVEDVLLPPSCKSFPMCFALTPNSDSIAPSSVNVFISWRWRFISWTISRSITA